MSEIKGYVVRGTWVDRAVHCYGRGGEFGDGFDAHLFDDLEEAVAARSFMARKRAPDARIFAVAADGSETPLLTYAEALAQTTKAGRVWALAEIEAAWYRAQETGRPAWSGRRSADDLANGWAHVRGALLGEEV